MSTVCDAWMGEGGGGWWGELDVGRRVVKGGGEGGGEGGWKGGGRGGGGGGVGFWNLVIIMSNRRIR